MKFIHSVALGLGAAVVVTGGGLSAARGHAKTAIVRFGPNCQSLSLIAASPVKGYTEPSVCVIRDTVGKRFYLFSGVLRYVARGQRPVAEFPVSNSAPLYGTTMVPVVGYVGNNPANTYSGWGQIQPDGQIRINGPRSGWTYTVTISGQIPVGASAAS